MEAFGKLWKDLESSEKHVCDIAWLYTLSKDHQDIPHWPIVHYVGAICDSSSNLYLTSSLLSDICAIFRVGHVHLALEINACMHWS